MIPTSPNPRPSTGFTLIELLTVIAIIAVLAALAVGMTVGAKNARVNSRAQAELRQLQTAIEAYKADRSQFPPDHFNNATRRVDPAINPLYYELRGQEVVDGKFRCKGESDALTSADIQKVFGRKGFLNASADKSEPARTYLDPKASAVSRVVIDGVTVDLLVTPFPWPVGSSDPAPVPGSRVNPWRYVSTSPTNNPGNFDLWAEVYVGKEKRTFKNW